MCGGLAALQYLYLMRLLTYLLMCLLKLRCLVMDNDTQTSSD